MADGQGYNAWLGYGVESTLGTLVTRTLFNDFISESLRLNSDRKQWNNAGGTSQRINTELGRFSEGGFECYGDFQSHVTLFKHAFGASSVTSVQLSASSAYSHTYALKSALPSPGLSVEINRDVTSFLYEGCKVEEVEFTQPPNDYLHVRFGIIGRNETQASASSPSFLSPLKVHSSQLVCEVGDAAITIDSFRLLLKNNLTGFRPQLGSADSKEFVRANKRSVSGEVTLSFANVTRYDEFRAVTNIKLEFNYTGDTIPSGAGNAYTFNLLMPQINWSGDTPPVSGSGPMLLTLPFMAFETTRFGEDELSLVVKNALTSVT